MRRVVFTLGLLLVAGSAAVVAQNDPALVRDIDILQFERLFLDEFLHGEYIKAYRRFRSPATALSPDEIDSLQEVTIEQLTRYASVYGDPVDFVLVSTETLAGAIRKDIYLLRYSELPLRAQFVFYNNGERWALTYFLWDDKLQELLN